MAVEYPTFEDIKPHLGILFDMLTGKEPADLSEALHSGWLIQGFLMNSFVPAPSGEASIKGLSNDLITGRKVKKISEEQAVMILGTLAGRKQSKSDVQAQGFIGDLIGRKLREQLTKMLLPILLDWLKKWATGGGLADLIKRLIGIKKKETRRPRRR